MRFTLLTLLALFCALPAMAQEAESIRLIAKPEIIFADGATVTTITAEVRDSGGHLIPDGQTVGFSTTLGTIEAAAVTRGGQGSVRLTSSSIPGTATVTASCGHATAETKVIFSARPLPRDDTSRSVVVRGDYLLYNDYEDVLDAVGSVVVRIGGITIHADRAQLNFKKSSIVAQSQPGASVLTLTTGKETIAVDRLRYDWMSRLGYAAGLAEPVRGTFTFTTLTMELKKAEGAIPADTFQLRDLTPSPLSIRASRVVYLPGNEVQFSRARIFLNGKQRLSLPYHVVPLGGSSATAAQYVGVGPRGPLLDVPFYLAAGTLGSSQLRFKLNAPEGLYGATVRGFALDLINKYAAGESVDGILALTRLTSSDWGLTWSHNQAFSQATRGYFNVDTRSITSSRYSLANLALSHQDKAFSATLTGFASHFQKTTGDVGLSLNSASHPLVAGFRWGVGGQVTQIWSVTSYADPNAKTVSTLSEGVNARLIAPTFRLPGSFVTNASLGSGITFSNGSSRRSLLGTVTANRPIGRSGTMNFTYNYNDFGYAGDRQLIGFDKQTLTGTINYARGLRWRLGAFATYGVEQRSQNVRLYTTLNMGRLWSANVNAGFFKQGLAVVDPVTQALNRQSFQATNLEARITRVLGERSLSLVYQSFHNRFYLDYTPGRYY